MQVDACKQYLFSYTKLCFQQRTGSSGESGCSGQNLSATCKFCDADNSISTPDCQATVQEDRFD